MKSFFILCISNLKLQSYASITPSSIVINIYIEREHILEYQFLESKYQYGKTAKTLYSACELWDNIGSRMLVYMDVMQQNSS